MLLLTVAATMLPHLWRIPGDLAAISVALLLWRWLLLVRRRPCPGTLLRGVLATLALAVILLRYQTIFGQTPGTSLLVVFTALKALETRALRDAMFCNILCCVVVVANFLFDQSPLSAAYGLSCLIMVIASFSMLAAPGSHSFGGSLRLTGRLLLIGVPVAIAAYIFFPRIEGSLWGVSRDPFTAVSGLSETVSPGSVNRLHLVDDVAMRVDFDGPPPDIADMYWRTLVLEHYDGRVWERRRGFPATQALPPSDSDHRYQVILEPTGKRWVPVLDNPVAAGQGVFLTHLGTASSIRPVDRRLYFGASSSTQRYRQDTLPGTDTRSLYQGISERVVVLAQELAAGAEDPEVIAAGILTMFREQQYFYTLTPPSLGDEPVDDFLFGTRRGYCEHYASAFAVLMRAAGVPARLVVGYQGGELNRSGDYYIVRQSDAHAWAEIWVEGRGWLRVDPTAAVAPERIELGMDALRRLQSAGALNRGMTDSDLRALLELGWMDRLTQDIAMWSDAVTHQWNLWVLSYGPEQQRNLLRRLGIDTPSWMWMILGLVVSLTLFMLAVMILLSLPGREPDSAVTHYRRFKRKLARAGLETRRGEGPVDYARRAVALFPERAADIEAVVGEYAALQYARAGGGASLRSLKSRVRRFRTPETRAVGAPRP
jgi:hypothetical protein